MSLLVFSNVCPSPSSSSSLVAAATPVSRLQYKPVSKPFNGVRFENAALHNNTFIVNASADIGGASTAETTETKKEVVPIDKLPLESKLEERTEQKLKMKLAKKIRLHRKRLVRKGRLRKKGRWPPSKMKKLKNV